MESQPSDSGDGELPNTAASAVNLTKIFLFHRLEDVCRFARVIQNRYNSRNTLYKNPKTGDFYLVITKGRATPVLYNKICNIAVEYGEYVPSGAASIAYYNEHFTMMIKNRAVQKLANL